MPRKGEVFAAKPGERFGRLTVISAAGKKRSCRCDCGSEITVGRTSTLTNGNTKSCGCLRREVTQKNHIKHGATVNRTRAYSTWIGMRQRCTNPNNRKWPRYGGRGIKICDRWLESFEAFLEDMGEPLPGQSIDRVDNDGPYSPDNCRWSTNDEQAVNRSNNRTLSYRGRKLTVAEWSRELGIPYRTILSRLRYGWGINQVLETKTHEL